MRPIFFTLPAMSYDCVMRLIHASDLSLATKGLVLLAIPVMFELAIVGTLWSMFEEANDRARNIAVSREIIVKLGHLSATLMQSSEAMLMYNFTAKQADLETYQKNRQDLQSTLAKLDKIFVQTGRERAALESLRRATLSIDEELAAQQTLEDSTMARIRKCGMIRRDLQTKSQRFKEAVSAITNIEKVAENKNLSREEESRSRIKTLLACAFCLSLMIAGLLSTFFYKNIVSRINLLKENSKLLSAGNLIAPPVHGSDEIAVLHRAMHQASADLIEAAKEKQKVALMMSHDLRSPLMSVQGNISLVLKGAYGKLSKEAAERLQIAETSIDRLVSMISQFLDSEKVKDAPLKLEEIKLETLFNQTMQMLVGTTGNTRVICRNGDTALTVDPVLMGRVFTNLISNAIKFSPPDGSIIVSSRRTDDATEISVSDEGPGVPEDLQGTIFEPFVQTPEGRRIPKTSGLGLSICKEIVDQHGGQISVENNSGGGATFTIILPDLE